MCILGLGGGWGKTDFTSQGSVIRIHGTLVHVSFSPGILGVISEILISQK